MLDIIHNSCDVWSIHEMCFLKDTTHIALTILAMHCIAMFYTFIRWNMFLSKISNMYSVGPNPVKDTTHLPGHEKIRSSPECCRQVLNLLYSSGSALTEAFAMIVFFVVNWKCCIIRLMLEDKQCRWALEEASTSTQRKNWKLSFALIDFQS